MARLEDNTNFLNERQVHPDYPKRENLPVEKKKEVKKEEEEIKKPSKDDQMSLF
jgi:hypothetical protein